jgi:hypothetical protein
MLLVDEENIQNSEKSKCKPFSVHKMLNNKMKTEEDYWTLYKELLDDGEKLFRYFRLSRN